MVAGTRGNLILRNSSRNRILASLLSHDFQESERPSCSSATPASPLPAKTPPCNTKLSSPPAAKASSTTRSAAPPRPPGTHESARASPRRRHRCRLETRPPRSHREEPNRLHRTTPPRRGRLPVLTDQIDTTTPAGRFFFHIMASLAQMERELTVERAILSVS